MNRSGSIGAALVTLGLATAIHFDWHAARPMEHHLSLGWGWHWLIAIPVFALAAWYVHRVWPGASVRASAWIVGVASVLAAGVEPAWEYWTGASWDWAFGPARLAAFGEFLAAGLATTATALWLFGRAARTARPRRA